MFYLRLRLPLIPALLLIALGIDTQAAADAPVKLSHGPMLGRPTANSMRVWGRTSGPASLAFRYGNSADKLDQRSAEVATKLENDCTGSVDLPGLEPGTRYHYQAVVDGKLSGPAGTFRTLPAADKTKLNPEGLFNFRFEFACGNNQNPGDGLGPSLPTYTTMLREIREKVDFAILNGDWLYEDQRDYPAEKWLDQLGIEQDRMPRRVWVAPTTVGVWENYKTYLSRAENLSRWHRHVPSYFTFDDHEIVNDVFASGEPGYSDRRAVFRDIGVAAWFDYLGWSNPTRYEQPIHFGRCRLEAESDVLTDPMADFTKIDFAKAASLHVHWGTPNAGRKEVEFDEEQGDPNAGVYEVVEVLDAHRLKIRPAARADGAASYSIGRRSYGKFRVSNCDFFLLDTRSHRQLHDVRTPAKEGRSMLGSHQTDWLLEEMQASDAEFFFVVSSVNFMIPHIGGGGVAFDVANKDDAWTVFLDEREKLIDHFDALGKPVFILTGDLHNSFAIKITDRVWEFASGPHNSVNHRPLDEGDRPVTGRYQYGPRPCEIRWSTTCMADIPRSDRLVPSYCVVQVNNVFNNPKKFGDTRWVAYPQPQVIFQYFDGLTGDLRYAEAISLTSSSPVEKKAWSRRTTAE